MVEIFFGDMVFKICLFINQHLRWLAGYTENWSEEIFVIDAPLKTNPLTYKIKDLNRETIRGSFYEKELFLSKLEVLLSRTR